MAIYQLEEEKGAAIYEDIAKMLGLTVVSTRVYVTDLINMGYPIYGERIFNRKMKLRISKEFREQNLISEVLALRESKTIKQKPSFPSNQK
jgi:Mn-dependent DtxR family transcriptional regulator